MTTNATNDNEVAQAYREAAGIATAERPTRTFAEAVAAARNAGQKYTPPEDFTPRPEGDIPKVKLAELIDFKSLELPAFTLTAAEIATAMHKLDEAFEANPLPELLHAMIGKDRIEQVIGPALFAAINRFFAAVCTIEIDHAIGQSAAELEAAEAAWDLLKADQPPSNAAEVWRAFLQHLSTCGQIQPYRGRKAPESTAMIRQNFEDRALAVKEPFNEREFLFYVAKSRHWFLPQRFISGVAQEREPDVQKINEDLLDGRHAKVWSHPKEAEQINALKAMALNRRFAVIFRILRRAAKAAK